jgi:hypothetical protein
VPAGLDGLGGTTREEPADTGGRSKQRSSAKENNDVTDVTAERKLFSERYDMTVRKHLLNSIVGMMCPLIMSRRRTRWQR